MSGNPTVGEVQTQWSNLVTAFESMRRYGDDILLGLLGAVEQGVNGDFTPTAQTSFVAGTRAGFSGQVNRGRALTGLQSLIYEYGKAIDSPYTELGFVFRDIYDYNHANSIFVPKRNITFGPVTPVGGPIGDGTIKRLTLDEHGMDLQACRAEVKRIICRQDQNTGARKYGEVLEIHGTQASIDALDLLNRGTGPLGTVVSRHAGSGVGGSLLRNASFSQFDGTDFNGWTKTGTVGQDTTNFYRSYPGATVDASAALTGPAQLVQPISVGALSLDINTPHYLRMMYNAGINGATGTLVLSVGGSDATVAAVEAAGPGWHEVFIPLDQKAWVRNMNQPDMKVSIDFQGAGILLVDDGIFTPFDLVDGTYLVPLGGPQPWMLDDEYSITDTGGDPTGGGILNYWCYIAGLGYLPHEDGGAINWADPTIPN